VKHIVKLSGLNIDEKKPAHYVLGDHHLEIERAIKDAGKTKYKLILVDERA
jgi:hypothetical protein